MQLAKDHYGEVADPLKVWSNPYKTVEQMTILQSMKKFKEDCNNAGGRWKFSTDKNEWQVNGKCTFDSTKVATLDDIYININRPHRGWEFSPELKQELRKKYHEENYGVIRLDVKDKRIKEGYDGKSITVFGFPGTASWKKSGLYLITKDDIKAMKKYNKEQDNPHLKKTIDEFAARIKVDSRSQVGMDFETPPEIKKVLATQGIDLPTSVGSMKVMFKDPKKCDIMAFGNTHSSYSHIPANPFGNTRKDPELSFITELRVDCYL